MNSAEIFRQIIAPTLEEIARLGYQTKTSKEHEHFSIEMNKGDDDFNISASRRTSRNYGLHAAAFEEEKKRRRRLPQNPEVWVKAPEDLITHKLVRIASMEKKYSLSTSPRETIIADLHAYITQERQRALTDFDKYAQDPLKLFYLRMQSDVHDVIALLETNKLDLGLLRDYLVKQPIFTGENGEKSLNVIELVHPKIKDALSIRTHSGPLRLELEDEKDPTNLVPGSS